MFFWNKEEDRRKAERVECRYETTISFYDKNKEYMNIYGEILNISKTGFLFNSPDLISSEYLSPSIHILNFDHQFKIVKKSFKGLHSEFELPLTEEKWQFFKKKFGIKS